MSLWSYTPLVTAKDLVWICHLGLLRPVWRLFPPVTGLLGRMVVPVDARLRRACGIRATRRIEQWLRIGREEAEALAGRFLRHGTRRALEDLSPNTPGPLRVTGGENLDAARASGNGLILVSLHTFAGRSAKRALAAQGTGIVTVRKPRNRIAGEFGLRAVAWRYEQYLKDLLPDSIDVDSPDCALTLLRRLRQGALVHITIDARVSTRTEVLPLLGGQWPFSAGALDLARAARCPLVPFHSEYRAGGLSVHFGAAMDPSAGLAQFVAVLDTLIRACPDQWERWGDE